MAALWSVGARGAAARDTTTGRAATIAGYHWLLVVVVVVFIVVVVLVSPQEKFKQQHVAMILCSNRFNRTYQEWKSWNHIFGSAMWYFVTSFWDIKEPWNRQENKRGQSREKGLTEWLLAEQPTPVKPNFLLLTDCQPQKGQSFWCFPECVARIPVSLWGSGGEAVFAKNW